MYEFKEKKSKLGRRLYFVVLAVFLCPLLPGAAGVGKAQSLSGTELGALPCLPGQRDAGDAGADQRLLLCRALRTERRVLRLVPLHRGRPWGIALPHPHPGAVL